MSLPLLANTGTFLLPSGTTRTQSARLFPLPFCLTQMCKGGYHLAIDNRPAAATRPDTL